MISLILEEQFKLLFGHITTVTVCEDYRRIGIPSTLMNLLEKTSDCFYGAQFVGLYVRSTNTMVHQMYYKLGYILYRRIINYYESINEDGLDMRKSLSRNKEKSS